MRHPLAARLLGAGFAVLGVLAATPLRATEPGVAELIDLFGAACLTKFPNDDAVRQLATDKRLTVMPDNVVRQILGTDPGQGWIQETAHGPYLLTIEMPPYHTCAIRKAESAAPDFLAPFSVLLAAWAATQSGASLKQLPTQTAQVSGLPTQVYRWVLDRGSGKQAETLMALVTNDTSRVVVRLTRSIHVP
jgi:hypothetical protein